MNSNSFVRRAYELLICCASKLQSPVLLMIRVYWGWQFFLTGKGKFANHDNVVDFFTSLHIPFPALNAWIVACVECFGGLLLLIGLGSRLVSIPLIFTLIVAYLTAESDKLNKIFSDPDVFTGATPFLFLYTLIIILAFGPGVFSVDYLLKRFVWKKAEPAVSTTAA